jgi:hypothetical protein
MFCDTRDKPKLEYALIVWNSLIPTEAKTWNMISKIPYPCVKKFIFSLSCYLLGFSLSCKVRVLYDKSLHLKT